MAKIYSKNTWTDEVLGGDEKYQVKNDTGTEVYAEATIALSTDVVTAGTPVTAARMNNIENGIDALDTLVDDHATDIDQTALMAGNSNTEVLATDKTLLDSSDPIQYLDPGGANRNVTLPAEASTNHAFWIFNTADNFETLTIKNDAGDVVAICTRGKMVLVVSDGTTWRAQQYYKELWIAGWQPTKTSGCGESDQIEMATNKNMYDYISFLKAADTYAYVNVDAPTDYTGGVIYGSPRWFHPSTTTNFKVSLGLAGVSIGDGETLDAAVGTYQFSNDEGGNTNYRYKGPVTSAITLAGTPTADETWNLVCMRKTSDGTNDTLAVGVYLLGWKIWYPVA